jgi:sugar lactone lactonase YvrE
MAHDVFISHSTKDIALADAICAALEAGKKIKCWIAPRDIIPGDKWASAIVEAIDNSRIMVLIFSQNSNNSEDVLNELLLAKDSGVLIIPFRIEDILPKGEMEYYLKRTHWLDAADPPTEKQIQKLVETVNRLLKGKNELLKDSHELRIHKPFQTEKLIYFDLIKTARKKSLILQEINDLRGLAIGKEGNIYISDMGNNRIHIFSSELKYEKSFGNKGLEPGNFNGPRGIAIDNENNVYVVDRDNGRIQKFDYFGNIIDGFGSKDEKSLLIIPWGICTDKFDNIYVSSSGSHQIKKFDKNGRLIKYWGESGKIEGEFKNPLGIAIDKFQNVYVADNLNNRIQKFDQEGNYLLKWGTSGDEPGQMIGPYAIAIHDDMVYVAESTNFRIQLFDLNGNYLGKVKTKPENIFFSCKGLAVDNKGDFYISNTEMHHIIQLTCKTIQP